jgi:Phage integrase, N-terminal SAM-like domain
MDHKPKLLDLVRQTIRLKHYSMRTERAYVDWIKRFIRFHHKRHPASMGAPEVHAFLSHLAVEQQVAASPNGKRSAPSCFCTAKFSIGRLAG